MSLQADPLLVTLTLDDTSQAWFEEQRRYYFPAHLNFVPAHLALFHHLPGEEASAIEDTLVQTSYSFEPFALEIDELRFFGRGFGYRAKSAQLLQLQRQLAELWDDWLTAQDRQKFQPHITVMNKANPVAARLAYTEAQGNFKQFTAQAEGVCLWHYRNGPWELARSFRFASVANSRAI